MAAIDKDILDTADQVAGQVMYALYNGEGPARPIVLALAAERARLSATSTTWGWDAKEAIRRAPNDHEHTGLCAEDAKDRMHALVDAAYDIGYGGRLMDHFSDLVTCLPCRRSATQVAEAA